MSVRSLRWRLAAVLFIGLAVGALGLLEPLINFWGYFHLVGLSWPALLGLYLVPGLVIALVAAAGVELIARSAQWLPVTIAGYYGVAAGSLAGVLLLALVIQRELLGFQLPAPILLILAILLAGGVILTLKATPRLIVPVARGLIGRPDGRVSAAKLTAGLLPILLLVPITVFKAEQSKNHSAGRPPRAGLATRPSGDPVQNILLITVGTLRADHLGAYGYARATSPVLDAFAQEAALFDHCYAQGNVTELSFGSIFSSLYPSTHGVRRYHNRASPLAAEVETLAEQMRDAGLRTEGLMTNPFLKREWGMTQGFDRIEEFHYGYLGLLPYRVLRRFKLVSLPERIPGTEMPRARVVVDRAITDLERLQREPFFLFVHLMDLHHPYIPPQLYEKMFISPGASQAAAADLWRRSWSISKMLPAEEGALPAGDQLRIVDLYDAAIRYADHEIGRLLATLDRLGLRDRTLVIITGDHGEEFLDHGDIFHKSPFLYDELTHVPLLIRGPGIASRREGSLVRHIDLLPTLLALLRQPAAEAARGQSLLPLLYGTGEWEPALAFSQSYQFMAVRTPERKLMYDLPGDRGFCFDLVSDPQELQNVYGQSAACDSLEGVLIDFLKGTFSTPVGATQHEIDPHTRRVLGSLGYVDL